MKASLAVLFVLFLTMPVAAHVVLTDGSIGVTMHIDPDDAPVAGSPSRFSLWFKDTTGHLDPAKAKGTFTVANTDNFMVASQPLFARIDSGLISEHEVTFPKAGVYTVRVSGASSGAAAFQPFLIEFKVRVGAAPSEAAPASTGNWLLDHWASVLIGLLTAALIVWWGLRPAGTKKTR